MVPDYDSWKTDEAHVTVEMVIEYLHRTAAAAQQFVLQTIPTIPIEPTWPCHSALKNAILTSRKLWPAATRKELAPLLAKYL